MARGGAADTRSITVKALPAASEITGPWEVRFPAGWGAPASKVFPALRSWTEDDEEGVRYFSGIAEYHKEIEIPGALVDQGTRLLLDCGRVRFVAEAHLNGTNLGVRWKPPFRWDITKAARAGANHLVVKVANVWSNRLVGDAQSATGKRYTSTNMTHALTWESPWKETPLLPSGLLGPVRLRVGVVR